MFFIALIPYNHYHLQIITICRVCDIADGGFSNGLVIVNKYAMHAYFGR